MKFLQDLYNKKQINEKPDDLSELPEDVMKAIQKNIREGADDKEQKWANALELVHKAYDVAGVDRPTPGMERAWEQYEENIQYAVEQLSKARGARGDWRMSSSSLGEHTEPNEKTYEYIILNETQTDVVQVVNERSIDDVLNRIVENQRSVEQSPITAKPKVLNPKHGIVEFWYHGNIQGSSYHIKRSK